MNDLLHEQVIPMPPVSLGLLERVAQVVIAELFPGQCIGPGQLDVLKLVDEVLPERGIDVYPVCPAELGHDCEGATDWEGTGRTTIRIREDLWHGLAEGGRTANRARSTVIHELAHVVLHVKVLRDAQRVETREALLNRRTERGELVPFRDPEWQAHALCGCILAPRQHVEALKAQGLVFGDMAERLNVSEAFLRSRLKRLKMTV